MCWLKSHHKDVDYFLFIGNLVLNNENILYQTPVAVIVLCLNRFRVVTIFLGPMLVNKKKKYCDWYLLVNFIIHLKEMAHKGGIVPPHYYYMISTLV